MNVRSMTIKDHKKDTGTQRQENQDNRRRMKRRRLKGRTITLAETRDNSTRNGKIITDCKKTKLESRYITNTKTVG